jgi:O-antigen/teichoic acid export membrane protein
MQFKQLILNSIFWRGLYFFTVLLLNVLLAQIFGATNMGWIYAAINSFSLILLLSTCSLESGMAFFASKKTIDANKLAGLSVLWTIGVLVIVLSVLFVYNRSFVGEIAVLDFKFMATTYISGLLLTTLFVPLFYAQQDYFLPNAIMATTNLLVVLAGLVSGFFYKKDMHESFFFYIYFINYPVQAVLLLFFYLSKNKFFFKLTLPAKKELQLLFRYSLFSLVGNLSFFLLYRIDYWFIQSTCKAYPKEELGLYLGNYIQVSKLGQMFLILPGILANTVFPSTAAGMGKLVTDKLPQLIKGLLLIYGVVMILLIVFGDWFFPFIYGPTYDKMYLPFLLLIPGMLALSVSQLLGAFNAGNNRVALNIKSVSGGLMVIVIGDWLFIPRFGIVAAALVSTAGYMVYMFCLLAGLQKENPIGVRMLFLPGWNDVKALWAVAFKKRQK